MSVLQHATRASLVAALLAGVIAGCGNSGGQPPPGGVASRLGVPLRLSSCSDWRRSGYRERILTIGLLKKFAGGPSGSPAGHGVTLPDDKAYKLFQSYCSRPYASHFR